MLLRQSWVWQGGGAANTPNQEDDLKKCTLRVMYQFHCSLLRKASSFSEGDCCRSRALAFTLMMSRASLTSDRWVLWFSTPIRSQNLPPTVVDEMKTRPQACRSLSRRRLKSSPPWTYLVRIREVFVFVQQSRFVVLTPEYDDRELRRGPDHDALLGRHLRVDQPREQQLLPQRRGERRRPVQSQRQPHAQATKVPGQLWREIAGGPDGVTAVLLRHGGSFQVCVSLHRSA